VEPHGQSPWFLINAPVGRHPGQKMALSSTAKGRTEVHACGKQAFRCVVVAFCCRGNKSLKNLKNMLSLVPNLISNILKGPPRPSRSTQHLMLAGINQTIFLNNWGVPEIKISLDRLQGYYELDSLSLNTEPNEEDSHTVWIYEKKDRIFFFKRGKLVSHFRWSGFREKWKKPKEETGFRTPRKSSTLLATTLSLVA